MSEDKQLTVFVDVDGVVADLETIWLQRYNDEFGDNLKSEDIADWNIISKVKPECGLKIYAYLEDPSLYDDVQPYPGSLMMVRAIREAGHRVVFATSSPNGSAGRKLMWLSDNGLIDIGRFKGSVHPDYIEIHDKSLLNGDVLIDDGPHNVKAFHGLAILYRRPHNRNFQWPVVVENWEHVHDIFRNQVYRIPPGTHPTEIKSPIQARAFREIMEKMYQVHLDKNQDYSPANILGTGEIGLMTRTWDKVSRLMNLMGFNIDVSLTSFDRFKTPKIESVDDSIQDAAVYFIIWQLYRLGKWGI